MHARISKAGQVNGDLMVGAAKERKKRKTIQCRECNCSTLDLI